MTNDNNLHLQFQAGCSQEAHKILKDISGKESKDDGKKSNVKAPFSVMSEAYLFAFVLGLATGRKSSWKKRINYANFGQTVAGNIDIIGMMKHIGQFNADLNDQQSMEIAIQEYATWGLEEMGTSKIANGDYRLYNLLEKYISDK